MATIAEHEPRTHRRISRAALFGTAGVLAAAGAAAAAFEASQNNNSVAPEPTPIVGGVANPSPEVTPSPTATISGPSESPVVNIYPSSEPEVTPTPTPTATPEATPTPPSTDVIKKFVEGKHSAVSASAVKAAIQKAYDNNSDLNGIYKSSTAFTNFKICETGKIDGQLTNDNSARLNKEATCEIVTHNLLSLYMKTGDKNALKAGEAGYNFSISPNVLGHSYKAELDSFLSQVGLLK